MQNCMICNKELQNDDVVLIKCLAKFQRFVDGMHAVDITEELEIYHEQCED